MIKDCYTLGSARFQSIFGWHPLNGKPPSPGEQLENCNRIIILFNVQFEWETKNSPWTRDHHLFHSIDKLFATYQIALWTRRALCMCWPIFKMWRPICLQLFTEQGLPFRQENVELIASSSSSVPPHLNYRIVRSFCSLTFNYYKIWRVTKVGNLI